MMGCLGLYQNMLIFSITISYVITTILPEKNGCSDIIPVDIRRRLNAM